MDNLRLHSWQRNLVAMAWLSYAAYYLGRVNLSPALPDMEVSLGVSKETLGLLGTAFFWSYAFGQLINGQLGDILSPRKIVFFGMLASAAVNFAFGLSTSFLLLAILWGLNGYFQSTGWGPILRTIANWLSDEQRRRLATFFGTSYILGNAAVLLFTGWLVGQLGWRGAFYVPAGLLTLMAILWYTFVRDTPEAAGRERYWKVADEDDKVPFSLVAILAELQRNLRQFWPLALAGLFIGFCLISLNTWIPTYFVEVGGVAIEQASALAALSPIAGAVGVVIIGALINRYLENREVQGLLLTLLVLIALFALFPFLPAGLVIATIGLMLIGAFVSATSSLTLSTLPLILGERQRASTVAGLIGFTTNIGGGLSTTIVGGILDRLNWDAVFFALASAAMVAFLFVAIALRRAASPQS